MWAILHVSLLANEQLITLLKLGGPRNVIVEIREVMADYEISVTMLAVRSFDSAANKRLSRDKASLYAREALVKHLTPHEQGRRRMTVSGATILDSRLVGKNFHLKMKVPRESVFKNATEEVAKTKLPHENIPSTEEQPNESPQPNTEGVHLGVYGDYLETLDLILLTLDSTIPSLNDIEDEFVSVPDEFYLSISESEDSGLQVLLSLGEEIRQDKLLLPSESEDLIMKVDFAETVFINKLKSAVDVAEKSHRKANEEE